ncbi:MAG: tRNA (5-methylaminomethyl-2-thiouridine)(34)-methyltransferase MnmD [Alphaproteobacteria bacterium]|nr:tRNA (5-methylaminomethyl-2-thiouridine)(34)-methyltransferase MnmD [Alphaproteobacteria bacterium]
MPASDQEKNKSSMLQWRGNAPVSEAFDDVYYSAENGLEETQFVFLQGIGAPEVWADTDHYVIAETGFGTGLNFLATWKAWQESGAKGRLTFISVEGFPLSEAALEEAHATFPEVADYALKLRKAWPPAATGFHPRHFDDGKINLILLFGDAVSSFSQLKAVVDAWYLDGFAPAKNPDMWSDALMDQIARLSRPGTRFATFTAAGFVKRALLTRGFDVQKTRGYGRKRERLVGRATEPMPLEQEVASVPEWASVATTPEGAIAVIGAGIAGTSVAAALRRRGHTAILISDQKHKTASNVPAAILAPRFMLESGPVADFFAAAYTYSCCYPGYDNAWAEMPGIRMLPKNEKDNERLTNIADELVWSDDWLQTKETGFNLPRGGSISTHTALETIAKGIECKSMAVTRLEQTESGWRLHDENGAYVDAAAVVVAAGIDTISLLRDDCPELRPNRGQVECLSTPYPEGLEPMSLAFGGYVTAETDGLRTIGSTFDRLAETSAGDHEPVVAGRMHILGALNDICGLQLEDKDVDRSWAGVRATTADHLPFAGPVCDTVKAESQYAPLSKDAKTCGLGAPDIHRGLYMLAGLGSKGFQYGPLLAEYLAAQICGDPLPIPKNLIAPLHPLRDTIRRIKRSNN